MYFNSETQARIVARFHFALNEVGYLFLGKAETMLTQSHLFTTPNIKMRVFQKIPRPNLRNRILEMTQPPNNGEVNHYIGLMQVRETVFEEDPIAQLVLDADNTLLMVNKRAREILSLSSQDLGKPFQDLEISYRPVELRSPIQRVSNDQVPLIIRAVAWPDGPGKTKYYDLRIQPLKGDGNTFLGVRISFFDVSDHKELEHKLTVSNQELETALEEVQSTNEELETTNEELQSTIEEIETTNEELQSTNEELETMNEELQSTNQELQAINDELAERTMELNRVNNFLESILKSIPLGLSVLDRNLSILVWNHMMEDLWGLRGDEVVKTNFFTLDSGLPVEQIQRPVLSTLHDAEVREVLVDARDRRGKDIQCRIVINPFYDKDDVVDGVVIMMETENEKEKP